jgi:hypothetical protein
MPRVILFAEFIFHACAYLARLSRAGIKGLVFE